MRLRCTVCDGKHHAVRHELPPRQCACEPWCGLYLSLDASAQARFTPECAEQRVREAVARSDRARRAAAHRVRRSRPSTTEKPLAIDNRRLTKIAATRFGIAGPFGWYGGR